MLALGGVLECRSNWETYVREFALALQALRGTAPEVTRIEAQEPLTPFERKYRDSGHALWRAAVDLDAAAPLRAAA
jgi:tRNA (guanine-N7-)-methyltransferase